MLHFMSTLDARFLAEADGDPVVAAQLRSAHYARIALESARVRRAKRDERRRQSPAEPRGILGRPNAKLTAEQVTEIREAYGEGGRVRQADLAAKYGVGQPAISRIVSGDHWRE